MLGREPAPEQLARLTAADADGWLHPNVGTVQAVQRAGERGLRLAILSNAPIEVAEAIDAAPWLAPFTKRFFSCYLRVVKPEPAAYQAVLDDLGAHPQEVVFFDDRPANVTAAAAFGIDARVFEDPAQLDAVSAGSA